MPHGIHIVLRFAIYSCFLVPTFLGCAAFHPMDGVPVRYIPEDLKVGDRSGKRTIKLSLLGQPWDGIHRVDSGDVLGIYIGGILGKKDENPLVFFPQNSESTPSAGTPVTVREDGTISLPMIKPLLVRGKTTSETEEMIRKAYTNHESGRELLKPDEERILVSLLKPRQTHVMVVRQDSRSEPMSNQAIGLLNIGTTKRGTGKMVSLPAYHNDVLNALVATDGLPGLDAENAVYIIRRQLGPDGKPSPASAAIDPEEVIRRSKIAAEKTVVRGQNGEAQNFGNGYSNGPVGYYPETSGGSRQVLTGFGQQPSSQNGLNSPVGNRSVPMQEPSNGLNEKTNPWGRPNFDANAPILESSFRSAGSPIGQQPSGNRAPGAAGGWNGGDAPTNAFPLALEGGSTQQVITGGPNRGVPAIQASLIPGGTIQRQASYQDAGVPAQQFDQPGTTTPGYSLPDPVESNYEGFQSEGYGSTGDDGYGSVDAVDYGTGGVDDGRKIIRIPIRLGPGEHVDINPADVILYEGDIVFIESRDSEVFFTGGLLGGGQYTLPRDFDLDILRALSIATSRVGTSGAGRQIGGVSALNSDVTISPSNVVVIRTLPEGGEVPIKINIYRARNDPSERLIIQPGDYIYLQYTPAEAVAAFIERHLLEGALFGVLTQQMNNRN